jgi:site-specific recombinase XerD
LTQAGGEWRLQFGGIEMKAGRPFGCHWPAGLASALNTYLERIRPHLFKVSVAHAGPLWGSAEGGALTYAGIAQAVAGRTRRAFGKAINPHLMRHILATDVAETRPEHHADISAMLAHASTHTAEKYYNLAGPYRAAQTYAAVLRAIQRPD